MAGIEEVLTMPAKVSQTQAGLPMKSVVWKGSSHPGSRSQVQRIAETAVPTPSRPLNTPSSATSRLSLPRRQAWKVTPTRQRVMAAKRSVVVSMVMTERMVDPWGVVDDEAGALSQSRTKSRYRVDQIRRCGGARAR